MGLGEIVWGGMDLIGQFLDKVKWKALVTALMNILVP
jgi:hypothetical protein